MPIQPVGGYDDSVEDAPWQDNVNLPGQYGPGGFKRPLGLRSFELDTTNPPWTGARGQPPVDLPGQFGPGGFQSNPRMTPPVGPPQGLSLGGDSLTARPATPDDLANMGPQMTSGPRNLRPGMSPAVRNGPGPFTDASFAPGQPIPGAAAMPWYASLFRSGPLGAAAAVMNPTPAETGEMPRQTLGRRPSGPPMPGGDPRLGEGAGQGPINPNPFPLGAGAPATPMPPPRPSARVPAAAGPAAVAQKPNLGYYTMDQPNIDPLGRGGRRGGGAPQMGVLGFDPNGPLFGRGGQ
jgi:hypothetical protein